ncbi:MAG: Smr/MutS family protein [Cyclobacteriaceae bacterium]|nr:Smr/MutS family protein [Cyclobacteriaceae bacterium]
MIFPVDFEKRLGFDQLRERLAQACLGEPGRRKVTDLVFQTHPPEIVRLLQLSHEALQLHQNGQSLPVVAYADPDPWRQALEVEGSYLELEDIAAAADGLKLVVTANAYLIRNATKYPTLGQLSLPAQTGKKMITRLRQVVGDDGKLKDNATPELSRVRKRLREEELRARRVADHILRQALENGWAPEGAHPTIRDGRLVVPLLAEHKRKIKGYLVDQSATGQTVFLEPADVLEANNDLRDLVLEERKEIIRILRDLTAFLRENAGELRDGFNLLAELDFLRAKTHLARDLEATMPAVKAGPALRWTQARHPLLFLSFRKRRPLIPLDVDLTPSDRFLLVSGPNAGGKSVCLKTVGLIQYMVQCGLLVPMTPDSEVGIFESIFLDIGDQQSIESDLSTYSSHLKNMATFIRDGSDRSLVLMDELGSGTDPNFGGGIAQAILEQLLQRGCWGLATTHYYNLKVFASHTPGIRNASMQFDTEKLMPLFRLEIGQPGSSFALEIAEKTGLSPETLKASERIIGRELIGLETLMKQVAEEKVKLADREAQVAAKETEMESLRQRYEALSEKLETQKKEILNRAKTEAATLLQETNREIEKTIRHIRENKAERQETRRVREGLRSLEKKVKPQPVKTPKPAGPLKPGDKVRIIGGEVTGTVLSVKGTAAVVQFGDLRSSVKTDRLVRSDSLPADPVRRSVSYAASNTRFSPQLDVRGMRAEELIPVLTRFMDDAVLFGMSEVSVLHGKGEGVLRQMVRDYLKRLKTVSDFRDEHADRGGAGITVVTMK